MVLDKGFTPVCGTPVEYVRVHTSDEYAPKTMKWITHQLSMYKLTHLLEVHLQIISMLTQWLVFEYPNKYFLLTNNILFWKYIFKIREK